MSVEVMCPWISLDQSSLTVVIFVGIRIFTFVEMIQSVFINLYNLQYSIFSFQLNTMNTKYQI